MAVPPELSKTAEVAGPLGTLALSVVRPRASTMALRAIKWHSDLSTLGVRVPMAIVHDLGMVLACANEQLTIEQRVPPSTTNVETSLTEQYLSLVNEVAECEAARRSADLKMSDDLVVVVLAKLLAGVAAQAPTPEYASAIPLNAALFENMERQLPQLFAAVPRNADLKVWSLLLNARLYVLTLVDALDLDTLQLFGMLGGDTSIGALAQVDLLNVLGSAEANDVVNFSLEILPSVLEAKARPGIGTVAAFGYAGLSRKGSIDSMVLTELAWDPEELLRRMVDDEVFYYAREQTSDETRRVHHILIDATASMRGERATFARGMAMAAAKKLLLAGEDVTIRFFDSRLYEVHSAKNGQLPIAYLLSFKGERGRNPARVFQEFDALLDLAGSRDPRDPIVHIFTHAALYIPRDTVAAISRRAKVAAVFMLPSEGKLDLDYLDLLASHWVVDHAMLASKSARTEAAIGILDEVEITPPEATANSTATAEAR